MAHIHRFQFCLFAFLALSLVGCHRTSARYEFLRTNGFRYRTGSAVVGTALDTLRVAVVVVNESRQPRLIWMSSICAPFNRVGVSVSSNARKWDSDIWQPPKRLPTRDPSGIPIICAGPASMLGLPPGASRTFVLAVPVREVLGDSLPNGRYRVTARVLINGDLVRGLELGDVDLSLRRTLRPPPSEPPYRGTRRLTM